MPTDIADAVVIGAGPNGLVAANALAEAGWDVVLLETNDEVGGAVRSGQVTAPGFVTDLFSAFYPLAAASPVIRDLELANFGLHWVSAPAVLGHALPDGRAVVLHRNPEHTAASVADFAPGDGQAWLDLFATWERIRDPLLDALFTPFPPMVATSKVLRRLGATGTLDFARMAVSPVRRFAQERFAGEGAALLLAGNSLHSDLTPDAGGSGIFGYLLAMLGQDVGFPVPQGGAGQLAAALRRRAEAYGARVLCGQRVTRIDVVGGRATAVHTADRTVQARRAILADVSAPALYRELLPEQSLPAAFLRELDRFQWDNATLKLNWALAGQIPWKNGALADAGTVHLGVDNDGLVGYAADLSTGKLPRDPFVLLGQMTTADPLRSPAGTESVWAYTHVPQGVAAHPQIERMEQAFEDVAPGFRDLVLARHVQTPHDMQAADANLVGGALNGGTAALHQQLFFRPTVGLGRPETPLAGLYLASASAHPGGGVHGAPGWNAALSALRANGRFGAVRRRLLRSAWGRIVR